MIWFIKTYIIAYVKIQRNEDILSSKSNLQPNWCLKIDFQKVAQQAGGKWLIHDTKHVSDQIQCTRGHTIFDFYIILRNVFDIVGITMLSMAHHQ